MKHRARECARLRGPERTRIPGIQRAPDPLARGGSSGSEPMGTAVGHRASVAQAEGARTVYDEQLGQRVCPRDVLEPAEGLLEAYASERWSGSTAPRRERATLCPDDAPA